MDDLFLPSGFRATGWHIGIKESARPTDKEDFAVLFADRPAAAHAIFTLNRFPGHPIVIGRKHIQNGQLQMIVVNSGNANVANGPDGLELASQVCQKAALAMQIDAQLVLPSSTGVIGRPMPSLKILAACDEIKARLADTDAGRFQRAIMTTDRFAKYRCLDMGEFSLTGMAKGAGMIEPNMATMLCYMLTDADIDTASLKRWLPLLANFSFNRISVDSDTSTSDTFALLASQQKTKIEIEDSHIEALQSMSFENTEQLLQLLYRHEKEAIIEAANFIQSQINCSKTSALFMAASLHIAIDLCRKIVADGEGATKTFRVMITGAKDKKQAAKIGRSILNSPLVKTALFGADPNWGRIMMAVGKVFDEDHPEPIISVGSHQMYPPGNATLTDLEQTMKAEHIDFRIDLQNGTNFEIFYGCDLTNDYVRLNSEYTT